MVLVDFALLKKRFRSCTCKADSDALEPKEKTPGLMQAMPGNCILHHPRVPMCIVHSATKMADRQLFRLGSRR